MVKSDQFTAPATSTSLVSLLLIIRAGSVQSPPRAIMERMPVPMLDSIPRSLLSKTRVITRDHATRQR